MAVSTPPGAMALIRIGCLMNSMARARVMLTTAPFVAE